jgi:hypothetical protein
MFCEMQACSKMHAHPATHHEPGPGSLKKTTMIVISSWMQRRLLPAGICSTQASAARRRAANAANDNARTHFSKVEHVGIVELHESHALQRQIHQELPKQKE